VINVLNDLEYKLKHMSQPLIFFEMTSMKLMEMDSSVSISELLSKSENKNIKKKPKSSTIPEGKTVTNEKKKLTIIKPENDKIEELNEIKNNSFNIDYIRKEWESFIIMITKERPSIGTALEHSLPTSLVGNKLIIEVSGLPDFSVGSLNRNNQVVESFLKDYFKNDVKIKAVMSKNETKPLAPEISRDDDKVSNENINLKNDENDNVVSRVIEVFDGEILR